MDRWIAIFKSHAEGPADEHFVAVAAARGPLEAIHRAAELAPPPRAWVVARAVRWPRGGRRSFDDVVLGLTGT